MRTLESTISGERQLPKNNACSGPVGLIQGSGFRPTSPRGPAGTFQAGQSWEHQLGTAESPIAGTACSAIRSRALGKLTQSEERGCRSRHGCRANSFLCASLSRPKRRWTDVRNRIMASLKHGIQCFKKRSDQVRRRRFFAFS
jgi:hypothetical protein